MEALVRFLAELASLGEGRLRKSLRVRVPLALGKHVKPWLERSPKRMGSRVLLRVRLSLRFSPSPFLKLAWNLLLLQLGGKLLSRRSVGETPLLPLRHEHLDPFRPRPPHRPLRPHPLLLPYRPRAALLGEQQVPTSSVSVGVMSLNASRPTAGLCGVCSRKMGNWVPLIGINWYCSSPVREWLPASLMVAGPKSLKKQYMTSSVFACMLARRLDKQVVARRFQRLLPTRML